MTAGRRLTPPSLTPPVHDCRSPRDLLPGLARVLREDNEIGGKTGTTNNASDGWYMGVTKDLVTGVGVGGDERSIHYRNWDKGQGSRTARPIFQLFLRQVYADEALEYKKGSFTMPQQLDFNRDCSRYDPTATTQVETPEEWRPNNY